MKRTAILINPNQVIKEQKIYFETFIVFNSKSI